jgi:7-keto-8-aminopelargonate synthetase-like enzyme
MSSHFLLILSYHRSQVTVRSEDLQSWLARTLACPPSPANPAASLTTLKLFSLNDYLGLSLHPAVRRASAAAASRSGSGAREDRWSRRTDRQTASRSGSGAREEPAGASLLPKPRGLLASPAGIGPCLRVRSLTDRPTCASGPRSSALVGGYTHAHRELEAALAELKGTQECLLFPTGYAANTAAMAALCSSKDVDIFSDELNHASIVDGARLAAKGGASLHVYRHSDLAHLENLLASADPTPGKAVLLLLLVRKKGLSSGACMARCCAWSARRAEAFRRRVQAGAGWW